MGQNQRHEDSKRLTVRLKMYINDIVLSLDKKRCIRCDLCLKVCPKEAITFIRQKDRSVAIDIDKDKCVLCGICVPFCPSNALTLLVDGKPRLILDDGKGLPRFPDKIEVNIEKCPEGCKDCVPVCPVKVIKTMKPKGVQIDRERCLRCPWCLESCKYDAIKINELLSGNVMIDLEKCPRDCDLCVKTCPTKAIEMRKDRKVRLELRHCVFCGSCVIACDKDAISLKRKRLSHGEGFSGSWNTALQKLATVESAYVDQDSRARKRAVKVIRDGKVVI